MKLKNKCTKVSINFIWKKFRSNLIKEVQFSRPMKLKRDCESAKISAIFYLKCKPVLIVPVVISWNNCYILHATLTLQVWIKTNTYLSYFRTPYKTDLTKCHHNLLNLIYIIESLLSNNNIFVNKFSLNIRFFRRSDAMTFYGTTKILDFGNTDFKNVWKLPHTRIINLCLQTFLRGPTSLVCFFFVQCCRIYLQISIQILGQNVRKNF